MKEADGKTILAIDYGNRRIGLAKSDPTAIIASALVTLTVKSDDDGIAQLGTIIDSARPTVIVIGYPLLPSGDKSRKCEEIDRFVTKLRRIWKGPIELVDEGYSSQDAIGVIHKHGKKAGRDKGRIDRLAATMILQRYLDEKGEKRF